MHYKHTQKDLSTIKIKKFERVGFSIVYGKFEMKMWTLAVRQEQQVEKVLKKFEKLKK